MFYYYAKLKKYIKNGGFLKAIKKTIGFIYDKVVIAFDIKFRWLLYSHYKSFSGIDISSGRKIKIVVSLTSFPARIQIVRFAIQSLMLQSVKPDHIILWLAEEQFQNGESNLPENLLNLKQYGLIIRWCRDIGSYKKLIPSLKAYPDDIIITADDDLYYRYRWLENLYRNYQETPSEIQCARVGEFYVEDGAFRRKCIYHANPRSSFRYQLTGGSGALYSPHCLYKDVAKEELFLRLAKTNDDLWFWVMAILNGVKIHIADTFSYYLYYVGKSQDGPTLNSVNNKTDMLFWKDFNRLLNHYPALSEILLTAWIQEKKVID